MITAKNGFLGSGKSYAELVEFFPNEPGIPFGDNLAHQVRRICHQFGDNRTPALPPICFLPVTNYEIPGVDFHSLEIMDVGGVLISVRDYLAIGVM